MKESSEIGLTVKPMKSYYQSQTRTSKKKKIIRDPQLLTPKFKDRPQISVSSARENYSRMPGLQAGFPDVFITLAKTNAQDPWQRLWMKSLGNFFIFQAVVLK